MQGYPFFGIGSVTRMDVAIVIAVVFAGLSGLATFVLFGLGASIGLINIHTHLAATGIMTGAGGLAGAIWGAMMR